MDAPPTPAPSTCRDGHHNPPGQAFCGTCGLALHQPSSPSGSESGPSGEQTGSGPSKRTLAIAGATVLVVILGIAAITLTSNDSSPDEAANDDRPLVTGDSECAGVPSLSEVATSPVGSPERDANMALVSLCNPDGDIRPLWPDGITAAQALTYQRRVCQGSGVAPSTPQDWYAAHPGSPNNVDDFAAAVADLGLYYRSNLTSGPIGVGSCN